METDGISMRRWLMITIGAFIIILVLLLMPAHTVSYNKADAAIEPVAPTVYDHSVKPTVSRETYTIPEVSELLVVKVNQNQSSELHLDQSNEYPEPMPVYDAETERILSAIAICESGDRQFDTDGSVLMNRHGSSATGRYQIMSSVWRPTAESMGINIDTAAGNKKMAYYILRETQQGIYAWSESFPCMARHGVVIK